MDKSILSKIMKVCILLLFILLFYYFIRTTLFILLPIGIVLLLAHLLEPNVSFLHTKLKIQRPLASAIVLFSLMSAFIGVIIVIMTEIYDGVTYLAEILPDQLKQLGAVLEYYFHTKVIPIFEQVLTIFNQFTLNDQPFIQENISNIFQQVASFASVFLQNLLLVIPRNLTIISESMTTIFFILLAIFLLLADFPRVKSFSQMYVSKKLANKINVVGFYLKQTTIGYIKAQLILLVISFFVILLGLLIIGIKHALTIALFMLIIDLIPFLGTGLLFIPWIAYTFLTGDYLLTISLSILYGIVMIIRQLIEPKILSMNMAIHPLAWLITAFVGMKIWGIVGLLLAPFFIVLFKGLQQAGIFQLVAHYISKP